MPFIPLHDKNPRVLVKYPWVTWGLILACSAVFLREAELGPDELRRFVLGLGMIPATLTGDAELPSGLAVVPPLATLVTHQFLHGDVLHLGINMAYLWVFGDNIEDAMGHARFIVFYLLCGAIAALAHVVVAGSGMAEPLIGASGAISGVLGAYLLLHPSARILVPVFFFIPFYLPAYLLLLLWLGFQFYAVALVPAGGGDSVAWWAHIGGFFAGLLLIVPFRRKTVPLWQTGDVPGGLKMSVYDRRPERRNGEKDRNRKRTGRKDEPPKRGPWE